MSGGRPVVLVTGASSGIGFAAAEAFARAGADVALVAGTSDYQAGRVRYSFLVVDGQGRAHFSDRARLWIAHGLDEKPFAETRATLETISVPGSRYQADAPELYVAELHLPKPGTYWVLAEPEGGTKIQGLGQLDVRAKPRAPAVGDRAPASKTPTLRSTHGDLQALTTRNPPDRALLRWSVAESLRDHVPFVVAFATPAFCQSRTCGPVVDIVEAVGKRLGTTPVRFIHVEIYRDNDPAKGFNRWVSGPGSWHLPNEPFTFVVDRRGIVRAKLSGAFSVAELEATVRRTLLS